MITFEPETLESRSKAQKTRTFLLWHFGHWDILVICLTVLSKLAVTVFIRLYFQIFRPKWIKFLGHFKNRL